MDPPPPPPPLCVRKVFFFFGPQTKTKKKKKKKKRPGTLGGGGGEGEITSLFLLANSDTYSMWLSLKVSTLVRIWDCGLGLDDSQWLHLDESKFRLFVM